MTATMKSAAALAIACAAAMTITGAAVAPVGAGKEHAMGQSDERAGFAILLRAPRDDFAETSTPEENERLARHFAHLKKLHDEGLLVLAGPTLGKPPIGLVVLQTGDEAVARRAMEQDPAVAEGMFTGELRRMRLSLLRERDRGISAGLHVAEPTDRQITVERTVATPVAECWRLWTTGAGVGSWLTPDNRIELRIGGPYEIYFSMTAPEGQRGSEGCRILSYLPERMLSFEWNAPPQFPEVRAQRSRVVILFDEVEAGTRVRLAHTGFGDGDQWDQVYDYFSAAWPRVMDHFASSLDR
ncbi:MAG: SRPBCC domain-containing protein [Phycisphaerales bacterium JB039]